MALTAETKVKLAVKKYLEGLAPQGFFFSVPVTGYNTHGMADILGCYRGFFVAIEVKSVKAYTMKDHNMSKLQMMFRDNVKRCSGYQICACSVEQVKDLIESLDEILKYEEGSR